MVGVFPNIWGFTVGLIPAGACVAGAVVTLVAVVATVLRAWAYKEEAPKRLKSNSAQPARCWDEDTARYPEAKRLGRDRRPSPSAQICGRRRASAALTRSKYDAGRVSVFACN